MKILILILLLIILSSCANIKKYYPNGQLQYDRSGWIDWSDGDNKTLMPVNVSGIGI